MENISDKKKTLNFIEAIIEEDLASGKHKQIITRFPPEPNGYLHIGHAKSICLNFGIGEEYNGKTNLRFDDTNPTKEDVEYVDSIIEDVKWLGFKWEGEPVYSSDYFEQLYDWAVMLIKSGDAYVDDQTAEQISANRGTPTRPGTESPYRNRTVDENLDLFSRMRAGEFGDGEKVLRAKTGMDSPNMHLRDSVMYRIKHAFHHRTGNTWCIYPMYDYTHGQSDYIEQITHSLCTLEFENHRPLYDWYLDKIYDKNLTRPRQIEFARLNLSYTVMSKRKLAELVETKIVFGWDDPRMPTISGLRRRGYTPLSIRNFADKVGIAKRNNIIDVALLEHSVREDLNKVADRVMVVLDPLKIIITNYEQIEQEFLEAVNNPEDESKGTRMIPFSKEIYIEKEDFREEANKKFFRLKPGGEVRLRYAYFITCNEVVKNADEEITELHCTYDPLSKGGKSPDGRKVKGTIHWVSAPHAIDLTLNLYERLFTDESPDGDKDADFKNFINPDSLKIITGAKAEPVLANSKPGDKFQFERKGYFCTDKDSKSEKLIFNRTVSLKDNDKNFD